MPHFSGAVGVAAVFSTLNRCGAARGFPSSLQHSPSQAFHTCLSSAGPLSKKSEWDFFSKAFVRHPSASSKDKASKQGFCQSHLSDLIFFFLSHSISDSQADFLLLRVSWEYWSFGCKTSSWLYWHLLSKKFFMLTLCRSSFTYSGRPWRLSGAARASIFIVRHLILFLGLLLAWRTAAQQGTSGRAMICLLKAQRPDMGTADSQVSHFMSGEQFDVLVGRWQSHFMISVEVAVFLSALTDMVRGVCLLGSGSVL